MTTDTKPAVGIHIVTWNQVRHLRTLMKAVTDQDYQPIEIMMIDNNSSDGTIQWLREHYPHIPLLRNTRNLGFARPHNQAIRLSKTPYILMLNPDVILRPDWLTWAVAVMEHNQKVGSVGGKLLRYSYMADELQDVHFSDIIDSVRLCVSRSRHAFDLGSGQTDRGQFQQPVAVFGFSGACVLYRREALESIKFQEEYVDEDFFAYKDDVDISWRLQSMGWTAWYEPRSVAYHHRTVRGQSAAFDLLIARNHRSHSRMNSYLSYRNHWFMLFKLENWQTFWRDSLWIIGYELKKSIYLLFVQPAALKGLLDAIQSRGRMSQKKHIIEQGRRRSAEEIRKSFFFWHCEAIDHYRQLQEQRAFETMLAWRSGQ